MNQDLLGLLPEIIISLSIVGLILAEVGYHGEKIRLVGWIAVLGLMIALFYSLTAWLTFEGNGTTTGLLSGLIAVDGMTLFFKCFFIVLTGLGVLLAFESNEIADEKRAEYSALLLGACLGFCVLVAARDLLIGFLALWLSSSCLVYLCGFKKDRKSSAEAATKFFLVTAVALPLFLLAIGLLFVSTKTLNLHELNAALIQNPLPNLAYTAVFGLILFLLSGLLMVFPNYLWAPDVLVGAPTPVTGFLFIALRAGGFVLALRILLSIFSQPSLDAPGIWTVLGPVAWEQILGSLAGLTLLMGSIAAIRQNHAKRMMSYILVSNGGFVLMGLISMDNAGFSAVLYFLLVEMFAVMGVFYLISVLIDQLGDDNLETLKGALGSSFKETLLLVLFLIALVGLPPFPGFISRFIIIGVSFKHGWSFLAAVAVLSTALNLVAVVRLVYALLGGFFATSSSFLEGGSGGGMEQGPMSVLRKTIVALVMIPTLLLAVFAQSILTLAQQSIQTIFW